VANATVTTTNSTLTSSINGFTTVLVQNIGTGGLWALTSPDQYATVTSSNGVYVGIGSTIPFPVHNAYLRVISNGTSDVRYT
jgi:hypothetical protein